MRIGLETSAIYVSQAGVSRVIRGLLKGFRQMPAGAPEIVEIGWPVENYSHRQPRRALRTAYRELYWAKWIAPRQLKHHACDLFHSTTVGLIPPPLGLREVATLYDVAFLRHPERYRRWQLWAGSRRYRHLSHAQRIICISRFTADEAMRLLALPASKLEVIYLGHDLRDTTPQTDESPPDFSLPLEFFLFVGSLEPGKNLALLKAAYLLGAQNGRSLPPLLIVGARWEGVATEGEAPSNWMYLGRQSDGVLEQLYRRALALVFPSKYEGFGLPVVEAMALGCPVICSRLASLPEVAGAAALFAEQDPESYLQAMDRLMREPALRQDLSEGGRAQAKQFTWRRCAEETLHVYEDALRMKPDSCSGPAKADCR